MSPRQTIDESSLRGEYDYWIHCQILRWMQERDRTRYRPKRRLLGQSLRSLRDECENGRLWRQTLWTTIQSYETARDVAQRPYTSSIDMMDV